MPLLNGLRMFCGFGNGAFFNALVPHANNKFGNLLCKAIKGASATTTSVGILNEAEDWHQGRKSGVSAALSSGAMFFGFLVGASSKDAVGVWFWAQTFAMANIGNQLSTKQMEPTLQNISQGGKPTLDLAIDALGGTSKLGSVVNIAYQSYGVYKNVINTDPSNLVSYYRKIDPDAMVLKFAESECALKLASMSDQLNDIDDIFLVKG